MVAEEVRQLILAGFPDAVINVKGEDANYSVEVISSAFEDINKLNRQKKVLSCVKPQITAGEIAPQSNCVTELVDTIYSSISQATIKGCSCCSVSTDQNPVLVNSNTVSYVTNGLGQNQLD